MYCKNCGKDNLEGAQVCAGCGAELQASAAQPAQAPGAGTPKTSPMAVWSLVLAILSFFTCITAIPGLILGIVSLNQINRNPQQYTGKGLATAGIVVSVVGVIFVTVIALLSAILFPVFARARQQARGANCMSNAKQLSGSLRLYQQDWSGYYPPAASWNDALAKGRLSQEALRCPPASNLRCGYGMNANLSGQPESAIPSPSKTVAIFESDGGWNAYGGPEAMIKQPRHSFFSIACVDGHGIKTFPGYENRLTWSR